MAQQDTGLPEGTDKIIDGSMETGGGTEGREQISSTGSSSLGGDEAALLGGGGDDFDTAGSGIGGTLGGDVGTSTGGTGSTGSVTGGSTGATSTGGTAGLMDRVRSGGRDVSGQAAEKARGFLGQGLERSSEALANVSRMIGDTADGIEERLGAEYGDYARRAATAIESTANSLASKDPDELLDDTRQFIRKSPGVALAGAAVVGFAIARLLKSGLSTGDENGRSTNSDRDDA
jgi:hypothetical protein